MNVTIEQNSATFRAEPNHGQPVTFEVRWRDVDIACRNAWGRRNLQRRYVVGLKGSDGNGFSNHVSFERACQMALSRCRRYERAYSRPIRMAVSA